MEPSEIIVLSVNLTGLTSSSTVLSTAISSQTVVATTVITGPRGQSGADGVGIPTGGTAGQVLSKIDGTNYNTQWSSASGTTWGAISGTLSDQTDLQTALDNRVTKTATVAIAYGTDASGLQTNLAYSQAATTNTLARRASNGVLAVGTPTSGGHATTKDYVDSGVVAFTNKDLTSGTNTFPTFNQSTTGSAATLTTGRTIAITGDLAYTSPSFNGSANITAAGTLATVNSNVGSFGSASSVATQTVNAKGLTTAASSVSIQIAESQVTNLVTDLAGKQGTLTLTTVGTSGASTLIGNTLNIPSYAGGGGSSGITRSVTVTSGNYTLGSTALVDYVYLVSGSHTGTLPAASGLTNLYTVKNNHTASVTVSRAGADTIDGATSISIFPGDSVDLISNGSTAWSVI